MWNNNSRLGLIAQEVLSLMPELVKTHEYQSSEEEQQPLVRVEIESLGINYSTLIPILIKAIQQQQQEIEEQRSLLLSKK